MINTLWSSLPPFTKVVTVLSLTSFIASNYNYKLYRLFTLPLLKTFSMKHLIRIPLSFFSFHYAPDSFLSSLLGLLFFIVQFYRVEALFMNRNKKKADFLFFLLFLGLCLYLTTHLLPVKVLTGHLTAALLFYEIKMLRNGYFRIFGGFPIHSFYLPLIYLLWDYFIGTNKFLVTVIGFMVGHLYYYLTEVVPFLPINRERRFVIQTPLFLYSLFNERTYEETRQPPQVSYRLS